MTLLDTADVAPSTRTTTPRPAPVSRRHDVGEYDDVVEKFRRLATLPPGSTAWKHQREAIVVRCLPLAEHIARRFNNRGMESDDLVQVARIGLVAAVDRFDVENGAHFASFAIPTITGELRRHFRDRGWAVRVPRRLKDMNVAMSSTISTLTHQLGRAPVATELAAELGVDREEVVQALIARDCYRPTSLDAPLTTREGRTETLGASIGEAEPDYELILNREVVRALIARLDDRQRAVLRMRFFESMTQSQIAEQLGVSQMHVSRILARTLAEMRDALG
ncbi:RNA polymerase sigma-B factor [Mycobacterium sp. OAS707]|uniref:SigB/SigF/SigG family RNA polymerase sigma factor n=1 Tax=Mycobacterium sp. OAS707 TaxID=2663822 RepID=UPI00178AFFA6|nr:SigB/SigF/SigG family RNA polymerase sigma factor [Mycobacterium sp. OAS707]MBE1548086.1 RNA polymerase sigma-B factor [Mycobacterium sp. OAS707]